MNAIKTSWTPSTREETIAVLWLIAALLAFNGGHSVAGWILAIKSATDMVCALVLAIREVRAELLHKAIERVFAQREGKN